MSTSLILPEGVPVGARPLGLRNSPSLRLSIGWRNPERGNAPDKLDHFRAKEGASGEFASAARKFHDPTEGYGPTPRAIDIRLPARLEDAIRIEYLAFKGNRDDPLGGVMVARGNTNFAPLGYCGGPDTLTVWNQDGTVEQRQTAGVDAVSKEPLDKTAKELGLMLCTTFCVGLPKILGFGSHAEITSRSLRSTDQIWHKLRDWYQMFPNGMITHAMVPKLVVKAAYARPAVKMKDGSIQRIRSLVYVLDLVGEKEEEILARLERFHGAVAPGGAIAAAPVAELEVARPDPDMVEKIADVEIVEDSGPEASSPGTAAQHEGQSGPEQDPFHELDGAGRRDYESPRVDEPAQVGSAVEQDAIPPLASGDASQTAAGETDPPPAANGDVGVEPVLEDEAPAPADTLTREDRASAEAAGKVKPPRGTYQTKTLNWIHGNQKGAVWFEYAIGESVRGNWRQDVKFERLLWAFVKVNLPDLFEANKEHAK